MYWIVVYINNISTHYCNQLSQDWLDLTTVERKREENKMDDDIDGRDANWFCKKNSNYFEYEIIRALSPKKK
jgi:hypothetical protein